jgi:hypothetical protein
MRGARLKINFRKTKFQYNNTNHSFVRKIDVLASESFDDLSCVIEGKSGSEEKNVPVEVEEDPSAANTFRLVRSLNLHRKKNKSYTKKSFEVHTTQANSFHSYDHLPLWIPLNK